MDYVECTQNKKPIVAVDFDGTLRIAGKPNKKLFDTIIARSHDIDFILWTCREGKNLAEAVEFCKDNGWTPKYVNENVDKNLPDCRKVHADYYLDNLSISPNNLEFLLSLK